MKIEIYSPTIRRKEMDSVLTAMVEEKIGPGERSRLLIQTAKEQLHFDYALALRSPAVALFTALKALAPSGSTHDGSVDGQAASKAAIISALSPRYYLQVLQDLNITPLYCDVSYDFPCISRELIENTIAKKPQGLEVCAIVLHHALGFTPDSASIAELGIPVIEDISQSYGSWLKPISKKDIRQDEAPSPSTGKSEKEEPNVKFSGVFCILGLEERDMLTSGGGALLFAMNRKEGMLLRNFAGLADEYFMPDINSALAIVQFKELHRNITRRHEIAQVFIQASLRTRHKRFIPINENEYCNYAFSLVLETGLKDVTAYARKKEIEIENAFENTIAGCAHCDDCPVSNSLVMRTVLFPMYPRLRSQDVERVSRLIMTLP
ncbi:DegT/DnrJ/EryC1/StrS family aminotransferase [Treponema sp. R80B11-R83G3]